MCLSAISSSSSSSAHPRQNFSEESTSNPCFSLSNIPPLSLVFRRDLKSTRPYRHTLRDKADYAEAKTAGQRLYKIHAYTLGGANGKKRESKKLKLN